MISLWHEAGLTRAWNDPEEDIARAVSSREATLLVGIKHGRIIANVMAGFDGHRGWIYYLCVAEAERSNGHGREMILEAELWLQARKVPKVQLMVRSTNHGAEGFYGALGYAKQGVSVLGKWLCDHRSTEDPV